MFPVLDRRTMSYCDYCGWGYYKRMCRIAEDVRWRGLQDVVRGPDGFTPVLIADLEDWDNIVQEYLGEHIRDG